MPGVGNINIGNVMDKASNLSSANKTNEIKNRLKNVKEDDELKKACQEFEALFVHMMLKEMRSTVPDGGLTEKSMGREIFEDMYDQEVAKSISQNKNQGIGLAKILYEQMKQNRGIF